MVEVEDKNIVATLYIKGGKAVRSENDLTEIGNIYELCQTYNDSGIDKIIIFDLSTDDLEHDRNIHVIRNLNRNLDIKTCAGGNIERIEDVKQLLFAGCLQVILNGSKPNCLELAQEASQRFGKDRILISISNVDFIFKNQSVLGGLIHELLLLDPALLNSVENITQVPHVVMVDTLDFDNLTAILKREYVRGITGPFITDPELDIMNLKSRFADQGIKMDNFAPNLHWEDLKKNSEGLVPVIVQDFRTDEVLMLAYMDEEAFNTTIRIGKMTYHSRSRDELWVKGMTSGHIQYVKSLTADCDYDTILAKVLQVGGIACHTGNRSCFFNEVVKKEYVEKNPRKVLESTYKVLKSRKDNPVEASFANHLLSQGLDEILKKVGEECTEVILAAARNDEDVSPVKYEITDLIYALMVLMVEKGVTWEDITGEMAQR